MRSNYRAFVALSIFNRSIFKGMKTTSDQPAMVDKAEGTNHLLPIGSQGEKCVMISNRVSRETKAVMVEARRLASKNGLKIDFEAIVYDAHAKIVRDLSE